MRAAVGKSAICATCAPRPARVGAASKAIKRSISSLQRPQSITSSLAIDRQRYTALRNRPYAIPRRSPPADHRTYASTTSSFADLQADHEADVAKIADSVKSFHSRGEKFRIFHGSTNSTRKSAMGRDPHKVVNTSSLKRVLSVNREKMTALVEPNVAMDELVAGTLEYGLVPKVVMEFPGITVGGGYAGTAGESSSFQHGFFDRTLNKVEMVLADGEVVTCSESEREDLFRGAAGAVGTLGVVTMVEIQLQKAAKFIETTYHPVHSMGEAIQKLKELTEEPGDKPDYVDGVMFSQKSGAIVSGRATDKPSPDLPVQRFSRAADPWFYLHAQERIKSGKPVQEAIPLPEYLFRYDRGGFWVGLSAFGYFPGIPFNPTTRRWLDDFLHTRMLYNALHGSGQSERLIVQDLTLPYSTAKQFTDFTAERFGIWPLWLCPLKQSPSTTMHPHLKGEEKKAELMLNIGLWGEPKNKGEDFVQANRDLEAKLQELGGMKWLYAQTYYQEDEFWEDFDRPWYEALRKKYRATSLPSVYEKVKVNHEAEARAKAAMSWWERLLKSWPLAGVVGLRRAIASRDYLKSRHPPWAKYVDGPGR